MPPLGASCATKRSNTFCGLTSLYSGRSFVSHEMLRVIDGCRPSGLEFIVEQPSCSDLKVFSGAAMAGARIWSTVGPPKMGSLVSGTVHENEGAQYSEWLGF